MRWSWRVCRLAGIDMRIHVTLFVVLAWIGLSQLVGGHDLAHVLDGLLFVATTFGIVVLHELGHALAARRFGIGTRDITLLPIGGVARLERMPEAPIQELVVALAGPAVNVLLAALSFLGSCLTIEPMDTRGPEMLDVPFFVRIFWVNVAMAAFNLLPAFPMDGGRVLRAALALKLPYARATQIAARTGQGFALLLGVVGLLWSPLLVLVALFVWMGAGQEAGAVRLREALAGTPVRRAMMTALQTVSPRETLGEVAGRVLAGYRSDFPVVEDGRLVGMLGQDALVEALARTGAQTPAGRVMALDFPTARASELLESALSRLQRGSCRSMAVVEGERVIGMVTRESVADLVTICRALRQARRERTPSELIAAS